MTERSLAVVAPSPPTGIARRLRIVTYTLVAVVLPVYAAHLLGWNAPLPAGVDPSNFYDNHVYNFLMVLAAALVSLRAATQRVDRQAWTLIAVASWCNAGAELWVSYRLGGVGGDGLTLDNVLFLCWYPLFYIGLLLLVRSRAKRLDPGVWLDGLVAALAIAALSAGIVLPPVMADLAGESTSGFIINLAYPIGDAAIIGATLAIFAMVGIRPGRMWLYLGSGLIVVCIADSFYFWQQATGAYDVGGILDLAWPLSALLIAQAAWTRPAPAFSDIAVDGFRSYAVPGIFACVGFALLAAQQFIVLPWYAWLLSMATIAAAGARLLVSWRDVRRLANTDALTGLGNRRSLMVELQSLLDGGRPGVSRVLLSLDLDGFKGYNDTFGHPAGDALLARLAGRLRAVRADACAFRLGGDEFCVLAPVEDDVEVLVEAAREALSESGEGFSVSASCGVVRLPDETDVLSRALEIADQRMYADKHSRKRRRRAGDAGELLLTAMQSRDPELHDHVAAVADLAMQVARRLGLGDQDVVTVGHAARLHDIGKVAMPSVVLHKPGPLDAAETLFMRRHTIIGESILAGMPQLVGVGPLVRSHHERWDGLGYPDMLAGARIPLGARIVGACDAYNAMITHRSYQPARPVEAALAELRRCAGSQFDPAVVEVLCGIIEPVSGPVATTGALV